MKVKKKPIEIVKENILRVMVEETYGIEYIKRVRKLARHPVIPDSSISDLDKYFIQGLKELQATRMVNVRDNEISITKEGQIKAENILSKHKSIEIYFMQDLNEKEAHKIAHILEHLISREVIKNMKQISLLEEYSIVLTDFIYDEGVITKLRIDDSQLFERMVSMGICPGQKIKIVARLAPGIVIKLKYTQIAIDNCICDGIMVAML